MRIKDIVFLFILEKIIFTYGTLYFILKKQFFCTNNRRVIFFEIIQFYSYNFSLAFILEFFHCKKEEQVMLFLENLSDCGIIMCEQYFIFSNVL